MDFAQKKFSTLLQTKIILQPLDLDILPSPTPVKSRVLAVCTLVLVYHLGVCDKFPGFIFIMVLRPDEYMCLRVVVLVEGT
jgi:hypothetical protein